MYIHNIYLLIIIVVVKDGVSSELQENDTSGNTTWRHDIQMTRVLPFCNTSGITNLKVEYMYFT